MATGNFELDEVFRFSLLIIKSFFFFFSLKFTFFVVFFVVVRLVFIINVWLFTSVVSYCQNG